MRTIGEVLDEHRGLGPGFDFLRVSLAVGVVTWHTPVLAHYSFALETTRGLWFGNYAILDVFFALSGFLIAGSAQRLGLRNFIINRSLRILPALAVEIVLSAFVLGALFTNLPLSVYFTRPQTWHYFTNIVGLINYFLPGVFQDHPEHAVNISLWTVPFEIGCYGIMSALIASRLLWRPWTTVALAAVILAIGMAMFLSGYRGQPHGHIQALLDRACYGRGSRLFVAFTLGIAAYLYRFRLPYSWRWFAAAVGFCAIIALVGDRQYPFPPIDLITCAPLVYIMAFLGVTRLPTVPLFNRGDYSYGIYLYGWPVMQAMRGWFPGAGSHSALLWLISIVPIILFAAFSWHAIEKPILRLRKKFSFVARQRLEGAALP